MAWLLAAACFGAALTFVWRENRIRGGRKAFHASPLETMVAAGRTDDRSVRIWVRSPRPGEHALTIERVDDSETHPTVTFTLDRQSESDGTICMEYPSQFQGARALAPATQYRCAVRTASDSYLGESRFETAPSGNSDAPPRFSIAAMSCHLPFDSWGNVSADAERLLDALPEALASWNVKRVLLMGDQVYGDLPKHCSLLNSSYFQHVAPTKTHRLLECSRAQVRQLYQHRHRVFWKTGAFQKIQSSFTCHAILDDHEIIDNFGSSVSHAGSEYQALREGALDAFYDYQGCRAVSSPAGRRPDAFDHGFEYGTVGVYVMDLRSERHAVEDEISIFSDRQLSRVQSFLAQAGEKHVILLVLSVPILHVPDWLAKVGIRFASEDGDLADRWSNEKSMKSRNRLLEVIREHQRTHPHQRVVLLGGDVHVGVVARLDWGDGIRNSYQLVSSAVSNVSEFRTRTVVEAMPSLETTVANGNSWFKGTLLEHRSDADAKQIKSGNPCGRLNSGIVEVERSTPHESTVRLVLLTSDDDQPGRTRIAFDSGRL